MVSWRRRPGPGLARLWGLCCLVLGCWPSALGCPASCGCSSWRIWCTGSSPGIASFPVPQRSAEGDNVTEIYIANQPNLESINDNEVGFYVGLKNLTVVDSGLRFVSRHAFVKNVNLQYINLSRNKLSSLSKKPFRHLGLSDLILVDNPFKCSCEIMWIKKFQETKFYTETQDLYCIDDNNKKTALLDMKVPNCGFLATGKNPRTEQVKVEAEKSLLCHLLSSSKWESNEAETSTFISALGYTSADYYCHLVKNMVVSLVTELRENQCNGLNIQESISASRVNAISIFCVPLITLPDLTPLLETLLLYHGGSSKEILSSEFLEAVNEAFLKKKISLPESAVFSLWLRHLPSLEKATLHLLDQLFSIQLNSLEEVARVMKDSLLPQAASHPAIFRIVNEIFKNALMETDGTPEVMTIIQVFTQLFLQSYQNENKQYKFPLKAYFPYHHQPLVRSLVRHPFELPTTYWSHHVKHISDMLKAIVEDTNVSSLTDLFEIWFLVACFGEWLDIAAEQLLKTAVEPDPVLWLLAFYYCPTNENQQRTQTMIEAQAVYNHLMTLLSCRDLSLKDLEAAVHRVTGVEQCCNQQLSTHLLTNFLLFSSGGHKIAQECIYHITEITDTSKEVYNLLIRTAYRFNHSGEKNQRTVKLMNELLQKLTLKV